MSPWQFHRTGCLLAEEPVNMTVRRLRLQSAAIQASNRQLLPTDVSVEEFKKMMLQPCVQPEVPAYPIEIQPFASISLVDLPHHVRRRISRFSAV